MATNPLRVIESRGQSVWQDNITRDQLTSGHLERLIVEDGISGVTSNPTIFQKAISGDPDYAEQPGSVQAAGGGWCENPGIIRGACQLSCSRKASSLSGGR